MPRRPRPLNDSLEDRWNGSTYVALKGSGNTLQVAGLESLTRTLFIRLLLSDSTSTEVSPTVSQVVEQVLQLPSLRGVLDCDSLRRLGAIWILDSATVDRPQNRPTWQRWTTNGPFHGHMILRIHSRPPRFTPRDSTWNIASAIVHKDVTKGLVIVDKPDGLPSHGTVDNAVENILCYFQNFLKATTTEDESSTYASLPHRLDTETSGLLIIATNKRFATYATKLFEHGSVTKHYRCLLVCPSVEHWQHLVQLQRSSATVTHFLDNKSSAPKRFERQIPSEHDQINNASWLECRLRINAVGSLHNWYDGKSVAEIQVELLTGRTHQIRGQMAALGCPIVGDPLYGMTTGSSGGGTSHDSLFPRSRGTTIQDENNNSIHATWTPRMALQCCRLALPLPDPITYQPLIDRQLLIELDRAWWSERLAASTDQG